MATDKKPSVGDKILEIIKSFGGTGGEESDDPVHKIIRDASDNSPIGGGKRKKKIDEEIEKAGG